MSRPKQYSEAFKREAVRKAESSPNVAQTARELGVSSKTLYHWMKQYGQPAAFDASTATVSELNARIRHGPPPIKWSNGFHPR